MWPRGGSSPFLGAPRLYRKDDGSSVLRAANRTDSEGTTVEAREDLGHWPKGDLPEHVKEFAQWLVTPEWEREIKSQNQWAQAKGINRLTVGRWKKDERFQRYLSKLADEFNLAPDRVQNVMNALYEAATSGKDVKAMQLYLQHADKLRPKTVVIEDHRVANMSEEDIDEELRELIAAEES